MKTSQVRQQCPLPNPQKRNLRIGQKHPLLHLLKEKFKVGRQYPFPHWLKKNSGLDSSIFFWICWKIISGLDTPTSTLFHICWKTITGLDSSALFWICRKKFMDWTEATSSKSAGKKFKIGQQRPVPHPLKKIQDWTAIPSSTCAEKKLGYLTPAPSSKSAKRKFWDQTAELNVLVS